MSTAISGNVLGFVFFLRFIPPRSICPSFSTTEDCLCSGAAASLCPRICLDGHSGNFLRLSPKLALWLPGPHVCLFLSLDPYIGGIGPSSNFLRKTTRKDTFKGPSMPKNILISCSFHETI
ncbi:hypothetical protein HJG60_011122 [Phyllostomus discolor]|uniref:Uncharacterized protein n=1 Tax=Phyllostomus discolor TaxID=89673 RepID=A0A833ZWZ5_9CHIR|nr:hypothetical protein HJG60_011122 [Phyllostomus discolor]